MRAEHKKQWAVGQRVRYLESLPWAWRAGDEATVVRIDENTKKEDPNEYQVFWCASDDGRRWWTDPSDCEQILTEIKGG